MQLGPRALLVSAFSILLLSGCEFGSAGTSSGPGESASSTTGTNGSSGSGPPGFTGSSGGGTTGAEDSVVATPSVAGTLSVAAGASQAISVTFTSSDGLPISGFAISATTLPTGWSGPDGFNCTLVSTGNSCVLSLTYAPAAVESGILTLNYVFVDNANRDRTPGGSLTIAYAATTSNNVAATASPIGQISAGIGAGDQSVSVNFTTDDGNAATNLTLTTGLNALPPGWSSTATSLSCAIVSTGSGCQLVLKYAPTAAADGMLALNYSYTDDSGAPRTGAINIPYSTTSNGHVVATVSPTGQINAVEKTGKQAVTVTFTTDDGKPASNLYLLSDLTALPSGWSSTSSRFTCGNISTGNGCQLALNYAPTALTSGTLTLNYAYFDNTGSFDTGSLDVAYAATTNDNVVGTASPSGQVNAIVGMGIQAVSVTFTTDDGRPATALELTSSLAALPTGWSSTDSTFTCSGLSSGTGCQLPLIYNPTAAGTGTLTLSYAYKNNAGEPKTGSLNIAYLATTNDNIVGTPSPASLAITTGSSTPVTVTFTTDDGNLASALAVTSGLAPLPAGWSSTSTSFSCSSVSVGTDCQLALAYGPAIADTGTLMLGFSYTNNSGIVKNATVAIAYTAGP
jgi:hypothetical protein